MLQPGGGGAPVGGLFTPENDSIKKYDVADNDSPTRRLKELDAAVRAQMLHLEEGGRHDSSRPISVFEPSKSSGRTKRSGTHGRSPSW